jgi:hypothetical protein
MELTSRSNMELLFCSAIVEIHELIDEGAHKRDLRAETSGKGLAVDGCDSCTASINIDMPPDRAKHDEVEKKNPLSTIEYRRGLPG